MNVFEKYIDNVKQNKELTEIINDLCQIHFMHSAPYIESLWGHKFIKFLRWEIDTDNCPPVSINMYYIGEDLETKEQQEMCKTFEWKNLLIKLDGYE